MKDLGIARKDLAQQRCNNGRELPSVKRVGAARCVGFDGAPGPWIRRGFGLRAVLRRQILAAQTWIDATPRHSRSCEGRAYAR